jgi:hypothetical protein
MLLCVAAGIVLEMDGTPPELVTRTPLFAVANPAMTLLADEYKSWLAVVVAGHVAVDHDGAVLAPDWSICCAVAVLERIAPADPVE